MKKQLSYFLAALVVISSVNAFATNKAPSPLKVEMKTFVVQKTTKGKEKLQAVRVAKPGQVIEYQVTYKNISKKKLKGITATGPVPAYTQYIANTAATKVKAKMLVSIDGGKTFEKTPVKRMKKSANGKSERVTIPASQYTHIRWIPNNAIRAGSKQTYSYRVQVK